MLLLEFTKHRARATCATLLCAIVGDSGTESRGSEIERFIESRCPDGCRFDRDLLSLNDVRG